MSNPAVEEASKKTDTSEKTVTAASAGFDTAGRDVWRLDDSVRHKSFDFSDSWTNEKASTNEDKSVSADWKFRKFHQTAIFVKGDLGGGNTYLITSNLPEKLGYSLTSHWETPLKFGNGLFNIGAQVLANAKAPSGVSRASSFMVWSGTDPLKIQLDIPVIDDGADSSKTNLMEALSILSLLVLPQKGNNSVGYYVPPPSPLKIQYRLDTTDFKNLSSAGTTRIMVQLGGMLLLDNCVIEKVDVEYPNTKAQVMHDYSKFKDRDVGFSNDGKKFLHPVLANIKITVSTIEALTSQTFYKMLWGLEQQGAGALRVDLNSLFRLKEAAMGFLSGKSMSELSEILNGTTIKEGEQSNIPTDTTMDWLLNNGLVSEPQMTPIPRN